MHFCQNEISDREEKTIRNQVRCSSLVSVSLWHSALAWNWNDKQPYNKLYWEIAGASDKSQDYLMHKMWLNVASWWENVIFPPLHIFARENRAFYRDTLADNKKNSHFGSIIRRFFFFFASTSSSFGSEGVEERKWQKLKTTAKQTRKEWKIEPKHSKRS